MDGGSDAGTDSGANASASDFGDFPAEPATAPAEPATAPTVSFSQIAQAVAATVGFGFAVASGNIPGAVTAGANLAAQASGLGLGSASPSGSSIGNDSGGGGRGDSWVSGYNYNPSNSQINFIPRQITGVGFSSELNSVNKLPELNSVNKPPEIVSSQNTKIIPLENSTYLAAPQNNGIEKSTNWLAVATLAVSVIALFSGK